MKASHLRIGNCLRTIEGKNLTAVTDTCARDRFDTYTFFCYGYDETQVEPMPLTEEWLLRLGFKLQGTDTYNLEDISVSVNGTVNLTADDPYCSHEVSQKVKYVHQLQNLYHALTGKELEVKQ